MKMTFALPNGREVSAYFDQELLELLRQNGLGGSSTASTAAFMQQVAQRMHAQQHITVGTESIRQFLFDLQRHGILKLVTDPWRAFVIDSIRLGLLGSVALAGWQHQFIWSSELPCIISTHAGGASWAAPIHVSQLATAGFQQQWLREHLSVLQRLA
jgi:hypothetical protein